MKKLQYIKIDSGWYETTINGQLYTIKDNYMANSNSTNDKSNRWSLIKGEYGKGKLVYRSYVMKDCKKFLEKNN